MATEQYVFTGADGKQHQLKRFMSLPARELENILEGLPALMDAGVVGDEKDEDFDMTKLLPVLKFADGALRSAFIGTDAKYEKVINELTLEEKFALFGEWMSGQDSDTKKG